MTKLAFKGTWDEVTGRIKQKYTQLIDNDPHLSEDHTEDSIDRLPKELGQPKEKLRDIAADF